MTFSIIVVCYNAGRKLYKTIESIRGQTEKDYEIIIKDGFSTDGSVEVIPAGEDLKLYRGKDAGIYDAMNQAVSHASGKYLFFLNCGDYFQDENVLATVKKEIERNDQTLAAACCGGGETGKKRHRVPRIFYGNMKERVTGARVMSNPKIDDFACFRNIPCHQTCFYDRRLLVRRRFHICYRVRADYEHFLWCYYKARAVMIYMPVTVVSYEGGGYSETGENKRRSALEHRHIVQKYMSRAQIFRYRLILLMTLSPLRTYLASNEATAGAYQKIKERIYRTLRRSASEVQQEDNTDESIMGV